MARQTSWLALALLLGCSAPEDENKSPRCVTHDDCESEHMCYRTFCIPEDRLAAEDAWSSSDASAPPDAATGAASEGGAAVVEIPTDAPLSSGSTGSPQTVSGQQNAAVDAGAASPSSADSGVAAPEVKAAPAIEATPKPEKEPANPASPTMPAPQAAPSAAEAMIIGLIEAGRAPVTLIFCVGTCAGGIDQKECQKCFRRVLGQDYDEDACGSQNDDDDRSKSDKAPAACTLFVCKDRKCESDS